MATYVDRVETSVVRYEPGPLPENVEDLGGYVVSELKRLGDIILNQSLMKIDRIHIEPTKPRTGDVRYADGTDWNPGSGEGIYFYNGTSWVNL